MRRVVKQRKRLSNNNNNNSQFSSPSLLKLSNSSVVQQSSSPEPKKAIVIASSVVAAAALAAVLSLLQAKAAVKTDPCFSLHGRWLQLVLKGRADPERQVEIRNPIPLLVMLPAGGGGGVDVAAVAALVLLFILRSRSRSLDGGVLERDGSRGGGDPLRQRAVRGGVHSAAQQLPPDVRVPVVLDLVVGSAGQSASYQGPSAIYISELI